MKTTILSLVLASIAGLMYCGDESLAGSQEPEDKELRVLLEAHRDTLKSVVKRTMDRIQAIPSDDSEDFSRLSEFMRELFGAELELGRSKEERIALIEETLKDMVKLEAMHERLALNGQVVHRAKADRIKVEIELYKSRKDNGAGGENRAVAQEPEDQDLRTLLEARRDTLNKLVEGTKAEAEMDVDPVDYRSAVLRLSELNQELLRRAAKTNLPNPIDLSLRR